MSLLFEESSRDSRIFTSPRPRRSWPKIAAAFAAGVTCTVLLTTFVTGTGQVFEHIRISGRTPPAQPAVTQASASLPESAKAASPAQPAVAQASAPLPEAAKAAPPAQTASEPSPERHATGTVAPPPAASENDGNASDSKTNGEAACEQQTWPYVNHECKAAEANGRTMRSVRVIATDRTAPSTLVTVAPPPPPPRTTDGLATPQAPGRRTTDGSAATSVALNAQPDQPQAAADGVPLPRPKPEALARMVSVLPGSVSDSAMTKPEASGRFKSAADPDPNMREKRQSRREQRQREREDRQRERQATRNMDRQIDLPDDGQAERQGDSQVNRQVDRQVDRQGERQTRRATGRENASDRGDPRSVRERVREVEEAPAARRSRSADNDEGYTLVRTYRTRDGRRLSVREKPAQEERESAREERPAFPLFPFLFNAGGN